MIQDDELSGWYRSQCKEWCRQIYSIDSRLLPNGWNPEMWNETACKIQQMIGWGSWKKVSGLNSDSRGNEKRVVIFMRLLPMCLDDCPSSPGKMTSIFYTHLGIIFWFLSFSHFPGVFRKSFQVGGLIRVCHQPHGSHYEVSLMGNSFSSEISAKNLGEGKHSWVPLEGLDVWGRIPVVFERKTWLLSSCNL